MKIDIKIEKHEQYHRGLYDRTSYHLDINGRLLILTPEELKKLVEVLKEYIF